MVRFVGAITEKIRAARRRIRSRRVKKHAKNALVREYRRKVDVIQAMARWELDERIEWDGQDTKDVLKRWSMISAMAKEIANA